MKKSMYRLLAALILLSAVAAFSLKEKTMVVHLIGDSTIAEKAKNKIPETGWGTPFSGFFDSTVVVMNHARNGRSTKSFRTEGLWEPVHNQLNPGDYVFIQFGHNDEVESKVGRYTTPDEFADNLSRYVNETREKGAIPILLTPVTRRKFDDSGRVQETHPVYSNIVTEVANNLDVPLINLDLLSRQLLDELGPDCSKLLYLHLVPGEHPNYPKGVEDNTHFSEIGARKMAQLVLNQLKEMDIDLSAHIINFNQKN